MIKLRVRIDNIEIEIIDSSQKDYPRIVTTDRYNDITKSQRMMQVIQEMTTEAIRAFKSQSE